MIESDVEGMPCVEWQRIEFRDLRIDDIFRAKFSNGTPYYSEFVEPDMIAIADEDAQKAIEHGCGWTITARWGRFPD